MPQFHSEEDNSAFLEGKVLLGALNGATSINNGQALNFNSKQLSPIQKSKPMN